MSAELQHYLAATRLRGSAPERAHSGAAGGAPCGDLVRISLRLEAGVVAEVTYDCEGCAAARAATAATAEMIENVSFADAALIGAAEVEEALGGLSPQGAHAAGLAVDALHRALGAAATSGEQLLAPPPSGTRTLVAMSGGVDSAVAALLVQGRGDQTFAVTLELWTDPRNDAEKSCCSAAAVRDARQLAHSLGIPHLTVDLREEFRSGVVEHFLSGYAAGQTPNPCVRCNGHIRLDAMIAIADRLGAAKLATGHYARIEQASAGPALTAAADPAKDQTYMLAALSAEALARMNFPLAELTKPQVRARARVAGLAVADRVESQDLCFLAGEGKRAFLRRHGGLNDAPGEIVNRDGERLGVHHGHHQFTVGQRRGIGISSARPLYVLATDAEANRVTVGTADELSLERVSVSDATLHDSAGQIDAVRLRYHSAALRCAVRDPDGAMPVAGRYRRLEVELDDPARGGAAPGQTAVFLAGDRVAGHATIAAPSA